MHYFKHHIGDFRAGTSNMTRQERWIYRDMLDVYYDKEKPLPIEIQDISDEIGATEEEAKTVAKILRLKFNQTETGWVHERCEIELASYRANADKARDNGKKGGRPKKNNPAGSYPVASGMQDGTQKEPDCNPEESGSKANHKPLTNNHKPIEENTPIPPKGGEKPSEKKSAIGLSTYLSDCKRLGNQAIPEGHSVFEYATQAKIPEEFLRLQWLEFRDRYTEEGAKRYKAWPTVFGKSVRGNWFKLWYFDQSGNCMLTTTGIQAKNTHEAKK